MFSVLIANYNNGKYLETAIQSVLLQTYKDFEIIIVDDASTDNSVSICDQYKDDSRFIIEIFAENKGCGSAKRRCVELASGEICAFLDADDALTANALQDMVEAHKENPEASLVSSCYYKCDKNLKIMYLRKLKPECKNFLYANDIDLHFASFKREFYLKTVGIDTEFKRAVDQDLYLKLSEVGNFVYIPKYHYYYRIHKDGISTIINDSSDKAFQWFVIAKYNACKRRNLDFDKIILPHPDTSVPVIRKIIKVRNMIKFYFLNLRRFFKFYGKYDIK